jgi:hypothetical protein
MLMVVVHNVEQVVEHDERYDQQLGVVHLDHAVERQPRRVLAAPPAPPSDGTSAHSLQSDSEPRSLLREIYTRRVWPSSAGRPTTSAAVRGAV